MAFMLLGFVSIQNKAQDTVLLNNIEIQASKNNLTQLGKRTETIDSTTKESFRFNSVGNLLSYNTPVFIKTYGPGAIATTAFRGGNAAQTAVLWNGFNMQNAMLGQVDLSLLPSLLFENVEMEYGGSSSLWGSGAVGGSIHLNNKPEFGKGTRIGTDLGAGSFGLLNAGILLSVSKKRFVSTTKLYLLSSENNFKYLDTTDKESQVKRQKHAAYGFGGAMQEFRFMVSPKHFVTVNGWYNINKRRLPDFDQASESKTWQDDKALRVTAGWNYVVSKFKSATRIGLFNDRIDYTDSLASVFSKSNAKTLIAENENYLDWGRHRFNFGLNYTTTNATTNNYESAKSLSRVSVLAGNKFSFFNDKLITYLSARAEYFSVGTLPLTGNISVEYKPFKRISALVNTARVYRQPSLNELYWVPGGNINLKPEHGYTFEGSLIYKQQQERIFFEVAGSAYSREINDWILWIPAAGGNPSPVNIQKVWSRGTETNWKLKYAKRKFSTGLNLNTGYVLSTVLSNGQESNNTVGKQLIYTPRYLVSGNVSVAYGDINLMFFHQYSGYRFTTSDNSQWLMPYNVSSLRLNYRLVRTDNSYSLFAACNNLFNTNYSVIAGRMMPLRNYELGISIRTHQKPGEANQR